MACGVWQDDAVAIGCRRHRDHTRRRIYAVRTVSHRNATVLQCRLRCLVIGEGSIDVYRLVGIVCPVPECRHTEACLSHGSVRPYFPLPGVLPLQVGVVQCALHLGVVGVVCLVVGRRTRCENQSVGVVVCRIEHLEGRQFHTLAIAGMQRQRCLLAFQQVVAHIDARRETRHVAVSRTAYHRDVIA